MKKYFIEGIVFLTYVLFAFAWAGSSSIAPTIMADFGESGMTSASLTTQMISLAKILGNLFAANLLIRLGAKKAFTIASTLIVLGGIGAFATGYNFYLLSRLILGFGGALVVVYMGPIVMQLFKTPKSRQIANAVNADAFNTGNLLAILCASSLLSTAGSWQNSLLVMAGISLVLLVIWVIIVEDFKPALKKEEKTSTSADKPYSIIQGMKEPVNWILPFGYSGLLFCYIAVFSLFPNIEGFSVDSRALVFTMIAGGMVGTLLGIFFVPQFLPQRIQAMRIFGVGITVFAAIAMLANSSVVVILAAFLSGCSMFAPMGSMIAILQEQKGTFAARVAVAVGMFWAIAYILQMIYMAVATNIADTIGSPITAAYIAVGMSSTFFLSTFLLKETNPKQKMQD